MTIKPVIGDSGVVSRRDQFLIAMYKEMWGNINRHILVVWQSVGLVAGTFTLFALVASKAIPLDLACTVVAGATAWLLAHLVDANYWYSRNLAIIVNIERQFLTAQDLHLIHPYFKDHRPHSVLDHLSIQGFLGIGVWAAVMVYHFFLRVLPGIGAPWSTFDATRSAPYCTSAISMILLWKFVNKQRDHYDCFLKDAPGAPVRPED
jgi:hypothetical protein